MSSYPRAVALGDCGVSIEFGDCIDEALNARVLALDAAVMRSRMAGVIETVPTYRSLLIHYDPVVTGYDEVVSQALSLTRGNRDACAQGRLLRIPVLYGDMPGDDLTTVAEHAGLSREEVIARHVAGDYRVYMLGFQPGFAYLGGLDPALATPRRAKPRPNAPPGTISIGGAQCAVHSVEGPSGWHWIGRTPVRTYRPGTARPFAIEPGDRIRFEAITRDEWRELSRADAAGELSIEVDCHA